MLIDSETALRAAAAARSEDEGLEFKLAADYDDDAHAFRDIDARAER